MKTATLAWILFIFLGLTWGSSFILMKRTMFPGGDQTTVMSCWQVGSARIFIASLVLLPFAIRNLRLINKKNFGVLLLVGVAGNFIPAFLFTLAETEIDSSLAGLLNMSTSIFVTIIGVLIYKVLPSRIQVLGLLCGSFGLYMLLHSNVSMKEGDVYFALLVICATILYAISLTTIKFKLEGIPAVAITSLSFLFILPLALIACIYFESFEPVFAHPQGMQSLGYLSILSVVGTALAVLLFTRLIAISSHIFSSAVAYMLPVVATVFGSLDGEPFPLINIVWAGVIFVGIWLINRK